ncbi:hypothetical protein BpHYR1_033651 [Brachionus plicatilis]|uniref:Uncharacterized protein n=1 Tax=Brachionus plicatilis TaxID=10195 RepID=A0A3M7PYN4_BRAPC|nr:hypothetical protein BpHYR1_033651 [Brachionus plicatilis]
MKNKNIEKTQNELRGTRSRSQKPTQVLGNILRNTSLISSSLSNSKEVDANLTRNTSLNRINYTSSPVDRQNSDDTDYEMDYQHREVNKSQFAKKVKKEKSVSRLTMKPAVKNACNGLIQESTWISCQAHNLNLVIKSGFKLWKKNEPNVFENEDDCETVDSDNDSICEQDDQNDEDNDVDEENEGKSEDDDDEDEEEESQESQSADEIEELLNKLRAVLCKVRKLIKIYRKSNNFKMAFKKKSSDAGLKNYNLFLDFNVRWNL